MWAYEIISGLTNDDYIAFPEERIKEGMKTTRNYEDVMIYEDYNYDDYDFEDYDFDEYQYDEEIIDLKDIDGIDYDEIMNSDDEIIFDLNDIDTDDSVEDYPEEDTSGAEEAE